MPSNVTIYTTSYCPYCVRAKALLAKKGASYTEIECTGREDLRTWLVGASGQRTVPQVFVNGRSVGGFSDLAVLEKAGSLAALLDAPPSPQDRPTPR